MELTLGAHSAQEPYLCSRTGAASDQPKATHVFDPILTRIGVLSIANDERTLLGTTCFRIPASRLRFRFLIRILNSYSYSYSSSLPSPFLSVGEVGTRKPSRLFWDTYFTLWNVVMPI